ncbi:TPA: twin-arginine translocation signal domain-containing protein [Pseudomonas aeruginosa 3C2A]|nr:hypothetical protein [Pseudomonas aeruginosa]HCL2633735.1 twin-arginine translocation signal domain-containing protein [Pseudomonas aeruginosa 3C2A]MBG6507634.1 twin-arginine translocation signal domain-containing protein [Pseudomonas aeruginosa]MBG7226258.1 twin-arginine translocation signal domain-containing protein [Pseudomonas aeruginosa]MBG7239201.1 twin-arginine translocation signal domain-containing protein [Pseudomonas aeruginosa]
MRPWSRRTLLKTGLTLAGGALLPGSACSTEEQELSASAQPRGHAEIRGKFIHLECKPLL